MFYWLIGRHFKKRKYVRYFHFIDGEYYVGEIVEVKMDSYVVRFGSDWRWDNPAEVNERDIKPLSEEEYLCESIIES